MIKLLTASAFSTLLLICYLGKITPAMTVWIYINIGVYVCTLLIVWGLRGGGVTSDVPQKADYVVVYHFWFVSSEGFRTSYHSNLTDDEVYKEALINKDLWEGTHKSCAFKIVKLIKD